MAYCEKCIFYDEEFSDFVKEHQDSFGENTKPKEQFCRIFLDGIPESIWNGEKDCERKFINERK